MIRVCLNSLLYLEYERRPQRVNAWKSSQSLRILISPNPMFIHANASWPDHENYFGPYFKLHSLFSKIHGKTQFFVHQQKVNPLKSRSYFTTYWRSLTDLTSYLLLNFVFICYITLFDLKIF